MNMSYCRFQNTVTDLADCMDALEEIDYDLTKLSADEEKAALDRDLQSDWGSR